MDLILYTFKEEEEENQHRDPFNLSNDEYYNPKLATDTALRTNAGGTLIQVKRRTNSLKMKYMKWFVKK